MNKYDYEINSKMYGGIGLASMPLGFMIISLSEMFEPFEHVTLERPTIYNIDGIIQLNAKFI